MIAFLSAADTDAGGAPVEVVQSRYAIIFVAGDVAHAFDLGLECLSIMPRHRSVLGTCDVLFDLAFLIMVLRHFALACAANTEIGFYLLVAKIGMAPGAFLLRSDTERKAMRGADPRTSLGAFAYMHKTRTAIYDRVIKRARNILKIGHSVLINPAFPDPDDRKIATPIKTNTGAVLHRFWLEAPPDILIDRVTALDGDASDADADDVRGQGANAAPSHHWKIISAEGSIADIVARINPVLRETGAVPIAD